MKDGVAAVMATQSMNDVRKTELDRIDHEINKAEEIIGMLKNQDPTDSTEPKDRSLSKTQSLKNDISSSKITKLNMASPAPAEGHTKAMNKDIQPVIKE